MSTLSPEADALVDRALAAVSAAIEAAPAGERGEVLTALVASLIDSAIAGTSNTTQAAQVLCHYIARALADRGCDCEIEMEGVPAIAAPRVH